MTKPVVGFIGLGLMGSGFARRLLATGHRVTGYDISPQRLAAAAAWGVDRASSPAEVADAADVVLACVTTTAAVADVVEGPQGLLTARNVRGKVLVDHSTTEIEETRRLAAVLSERAGMRFVDAPVSGGPGAAESGTLAIMAGGGDEAVASVAPLMTNLGTFTHMGAVGAGQATKLVNQTLVLTNYCVIAEALRVAETFGIDAARIPQALGGGHAGSNLLPVMLDRMIPRDWTPKGYARQVLKDLEMLNEAARGRHLAMPMASQALTLFRMLIAQGKSELDGAAVLEVLPPGDRP
ncbi:MAG: NAD(P)-dependent oxidoreductase [Hyphomicrobiaceae bacterium]|nr:NAD(P)-dependent oxidoreductase [Hyphomicrobiaceae bacterium]